MKSHRISGRVSEETKNNFIGKCKQLGLTETELIEKISNEDIVFLDNNARKLIKLMVAK